MKKSSSISLFVLLSVMVVSLVSVPDLSAQKNAKPLRFESEQWDFGRVDTRKRVSHSFVFTNISTRPVVIRSVIASCACAASDYPRRPIQPGAGGKIDVSFDPSAVEVGRFSKDIYVSLAGVPNSNILTVSGETVAYVPPVEEQYPIVASSGLRLSAPVADFFYIEQGVSDTMKIGYANTLSRAVTLKFDFKPYDKCISVVSPRSVPAKSRGEILIIYSVPAGSGIYGHICRRAYPVVDGVRSGVSILAKGTVVDAFSGNVTTGAVAKFAPLFYHFGVGGSSGAVRSHRFTLTNDGKTTLIVRKVEPGKGASTTLRSGTQIKPGRSVQFDCSLSPTTPTSALITVITNDPLQPVREIRLIND